MEEVTYANKKIYNKDNNDKDNNIYINEGEKQIISNQVSNEVKNNSPSYSPCSQGNINITLTSHIKRFHQPWTYINKLYRTKRKRKWKYCRRLKKMK